LKGFQKRLQVCFGRFQLSLLTVPCNYWSTGAFHLNNFNNYITFF
jgi:hypothetical protein